MLGVGDHYKEKATLSVCHRPTGDPTLPSHLPCKYCAHCREEPLWGVEAEDGHAVGSLQAELQVKGRQYRSGRQGRGPPLAPPPVPCPGTLQAYPS